LAVKTLLPLGISDDLPGGGYGFFWNYTLFNYYFYFKIEGIFSFMVQTMF